MKFIISIFLTALLSFVSCLYFPWWSIAIVAFVIAILIPQRAGINFIAAFIAIFFLWASVAFWISNNNGHILAHKISLLILKVDNPFLLIFVTAFIGGVVAGFAAMTGSYLHPKKIASPDL